MSEYRTAGKTTVSADVLLTIARMAALEVEGVSRMAPLRLGVKNILARGLEGVQVELEDNLVFVELSLVLEEDVNMRDVSRQVQQRVARAISEMTGMEVGHVNIHIEDINFQSEE